MSYSEKAPISVFFRLFVIRVGGIIPHRRFGDLRLLSCFYRFLPSGLPVLSLVAAMGFTGDVLAQQVKSVTIESQFMRFPGISVDGIDYQALRFEYAYQGQAEIVAREPLAETLLCGDTPTLKKHLNIVYQGPEVIFRISDTRDGRVLLLRELDTSGSMEYGVGNCNADDVEADFEAQKTQWLQVLTDELLVEAREQMQQYVESNAVLTYESLMLPLFYVVADGKAFSKVNQAFDVARLAFDLNLEFGVTVEAEQQFAAAAGVWESKLEEISRVRDGGAVFVDVRQALHRNLTAVYLFLGDFQQARRNDALAIARGMPADDSLQDLILTHERRYILSPHTAADTARAVSLYRYGQNAISEAQVTQSARFSSFKEALGHSQ